MQPDAWVRDEALDNECCRSVHARRDGTVLLATVDFSEINGRWFAWVDPDLFGVEVGEYFSGQEAAQSWCDAHIDRRVQLDEAERAASPAPQPEA